MSYTVGIDLGTTFTCVEWISNSSYVSYEKPFPSAVRILEDGSETYGAAATTAIVKDNCYPFIDSKRFIGKKWNECDVDGSNYSFDLVNVEGFPYYRTADGANLFTPKSISSKILSFIYQTYSPYVSSDNYFQIKDVVITVPAKFSTNQRKETREAGEKAGFNVMRLINEPTAAAIAYIYDKTCNLDLNGKTILIYDFGGGTFDVAIIKVSGKDIYVLATGGDDHLGGEDITNNMMNYVKEELKRKGCDIEFNERNIYKLRKRCEDAKIVCLTTENDVEVELKDEIINISYSKMKDLNKPLFKKTMEVVKNTLKNSKILKSSIDKVILVGGSSNIKYVNELLSDEFGISKIVSELNKERVVSIGAAYYADSIKNYNRQSYIIHDIVNHSLGIGCETKTKKNVMKKLINKGDMLPATGSFTFYNGNYAPRAIVRVFEGEDDCILNNIALSKFIIPLEEKKSEEIEIVVLLSVDNDGVLKVTATCNGEITEVLVTDY